MDFKIGLLLILGLKILSVLMIVVMCYKEKWGNLFKLEIKKFDKDNL